MRLTLAAALGRLSFGLDRKPDEEHPLSFSESSRQSPRKDCVAKPFQNSQPKHQPPMIFITIKPPKRPVSTHPAC
jgi:hypothetical protein|nr:hypothetical protein [uncultured Pseudomonas sp.]